MRKTRPRNPGFTLIEVVVAVMVVAVGVTGVMGMVFWMVRANDWSGDLSSASTLGQDKLEDLLVAEYFSLSSGSDQVGAYSRTWSVSTSLTHDYKKIDMDVAWTRSNDAVSHVVLAALRSNPTVAGVNLSGLNLGGLGASGGGGGSPPPVDGGGNPPPDDGGGDPPPDDGGDVSPSLDEGG